MIVPAHSGPVYDGDTLHTFAFFDKMPEGSVELELQLANDQTICPSITIKTQAQSSPDNPVPGPLACVAVQRSLGETDKDEALKLALQYQLVSPLTNFLVVDKQNDKEQNGDLPLLRKVPRTIAAGWGGYGSVAESGPDYNTSRFILTSRSEPGNDIRFSFTQTMTTRLISSKAVISPPSPVVNTAVRIRTTSNPKPISLTPENA